MTDFFALFEEPRRPWLEPESLKKKFLARSAETHPDKIHHASAAEKHLAAKRFAELNAAYQCLLEPKSRLLHLLQLERGTKPADVQPISPALADVFAEVVAACREADAFLNGKTRLTSPLLQVQWFEQAQEWIERLRTVQTRLASLQAQRLVDVKSLDTAWSAESGLETRARLLEKLEELYRWFGYFNRWNHQLQERIVQLSL